MLLLCCSVFLVACSSSGDTYEDEEVSKDIHVGVVTAVQRVVRDTEWMDNIDWPWGTEDYNIEEIDIDLYNASGEFTHDNKIYKFDIDVYTKDGDSGRIESYRVY